MAKRNIISNNYSRQSFVYDNEDNEEDNEFNGLQEFGFEPEVPDEDEGAVEFPVEKIVNKRKRYNKIQYLVKWQSNDPDSWMSLKDLDGCQDLIAEYEESLKPKPMKSSMISFNKIVDWFLVMACLICGTAFVVMFVLGIDFPTNESNESTNL